MFTRITNNIKKNLVLYYLLLSGFLLRLIFATFPSFHIDADTNFAWSLRVVELGFGKFYAPDVWTNYTPGMIYVFYVLGVLKNLFSLSSDQFYLLLKIPSILTDVTLGFFVYKQLLKTATRRIAFVGLGLCLFNPIFIFNSSIWGAFDAPLTLFTFISIYFLSEAKKSSSAYYLARRKLILSSIFIGIALLIKPQAIALTPVFGLFILKNFSISNILKLSIPALLVVIILSLPFFPRDPIFGFFNLFITMAQDYKGNSLFAYNTWGMFGFWIEDSTNLGFLSYRVWGLLLLSLFWIFFYMLFFKSKFDAFTLSTLAFLAFFFLPTRVHERYLFSAIPFLVLTALQFKSKILIVSLILLSALHTINLYYVYVYYNEFYLKLPKILYIPGFYEFLEMQGKLLSVISTLLFLVITFTIARIVVRRKHGH